MKGPKRRIPEITTHWEKQSAEYTAWSNMRFRCLNPNAPNYAAYGGRGITIDSRWDDFAVFYADMGARPSKRHSLGRIDNDGPYSPDNCRWETDEEQSNNTRVSRIYTINGRTMTHTQWARELDIKPEALYNRIHRYGWSVERALTTPRKPGSRRA